MVLLGIQKRERYQEWYLILKWRRERENPEKRKRSSGPFRRSYYLYMSIIVSFKKPARRTSLALQQLHLLSEPGEFNNSIKSCWQQSLFKPSTTRQRSSSTQWSQSIEACSTRVLREKDVSKRSRTVGIQCETWMINSSRPSAKRCTSYMHICKKTCPMGRR